MLADDIINVVILFFKINFLYKAIYIILCDYTKVCIWLYIINIISTSF